MIWAFTVFAMLLKQIPCEQTWEVSGESLEVLAKKLNQDLKSLSQWLKANKLSLNVKKTELIIFRQKAAKIDYSIKFKLDGTRLNSCEHS